MSIPEDRLNESISEVSSKEWTVAEIKQLHKELKDSKLHEKFGGMPRLLEGLEYIKQMYED